MRKKLTKIQSQRIKEILSDDVGDLLPVIEAVQRVAYKVAREGVELPEKDWTSIIEAACTLLPENQDQ